MLCAAVLLLVNLCVSPGMAESPEPALDAGNEAISDEQTREDLIEDIRSTLLWQDEIRGSIPGISVGEVEGEQYIEYKGVRLEQLDMDELEALFYEVNNLVVMKNVENLQMIQRQMRETQAIQQMLRQQRMLQQQQSIQRQQPPPRPPSPPAQPPRTPAGQRR